MKNLFLGAAVALQLLAVGHAATLRTDNGLLIGASNINVGGFLLDVQFVDGSCIELFSGCDDLSDFFFRSFEGMDTDEQLLFARSAGEALYDQVFVGNFDAQPELTRGCTNNTRQCNVLIPFPNTEASLRNNAILNGLAVTNSNAEREPFDRIFTGTIFAKDRSTGFTDPNRPFLNDDTYAIFSLAQAPGTEVPVPPAFLFFATAIGAFFRIRQRTEAP